MKYGKFIVCYDNQLLERFIGIILTMVKGGNHIRHSSSELLNFKISKHTLFHYPKIIRWQILLVPGQLFMGYRKHIQTKLREKLMEEQENVRFLGKKGRRTVLRKRLFSVVLVRLKVPALLCALVEKFLYGLLDSAII